MENMIGFYIVPDSFAAQSNLRSMSIVISDVSEYNPLKTKASGFITINDDSFGFDMYIPISSLRLVDCPVTLEYDGDNVPMPNEARLTLSHGHLMLEDDDTIFVAAQWIPFM